MRIKTIGSSILAVSLFTAAAPISSQVVPQAQQSHLPFTVGAGVSSFNVDWGHGRMIGGTIWADWHPGMLPPVLQGLGVEMEARAVDWDRQNQPSNFREDTAGGGPIYTWRHYRNFRPYGKYLIQFGSIDFKSSDPSYSHETRTLEALGVGVDFRVFRNIWGRADYEYQFWPNLLGKTADPQGFTLGAVYDFGTPFRR